MADAVTILHVSAPAAHAPSASAALAPVIVDWLLLHEGIPLVPGAGYSLALPPPARLAGIASREDKASALISLLTQLGFSSVAPGYLSPPDEWPLEVPCPGYHPPASAAGGAVVTSTFTPSPPRVTARAVWGGAAVALGQIGLGSRAIVLEHLPRLVTPRAVDVAAVLLPSGLWLAPSARGQVLGNSPSEIGVKLTAGGRATSQVSIPRRSI